MSYETAWVGLGEADAAQGSIEQRLAKLQRLREEGALSGEEYAAQRQRILDFL